MFLAGFLRGFGKVWKKESRVWKNYVCLQTLLFFYRIEIKCIVREESRLVIVKYAFFVLCKMQVISILVSSQNILSIVLYSLKDLCKNKQYTAFHVCMRNH